MILTVQLEICRRRRQTLKKMLKIVQEKIDIQTRKRKSKDRLTDDDSGGEVIKSRKEQEKGERAR